MVRFAIALLFVIGTAAVVSGPAGPFRTVNVRAADAPVTFARDILPILQKNCQSCHRPGQIAPMSLLTYQDARPWARSIKAKVESRQMPPVTKQAAPYAAPYEMNWLSASGTACFLAAIATALVLRITPAQFLKTYVATFKQLKFAILTIASMLGLAYLMNYSGMTSTLGLSLASTGRAFPFFSAFVGWLGVFLTGSDTSANALFGNLQVITANALNLNPILTASVNSAAGVMGKICPNCSHKYELDATFCGRDGAELVVVN